MDAFTSDTLPASALIRSTFEQSPFSTVVYDAEGRPLALNPAFRRLWGVGMESIPPGYSVLSDPLLERAGVLPYIHRAFGGEPVTTPPVRYDVAELSTGPGGRVVWTQAHCLPVRGRDGRVERVFLTHVDLSERLRVEEALRASERRFAAIVERVTVGIAQADLEGRLTLVNDRFCEMLGRSREELLGRTVAELTHPDDFDRNRELLHRMGATGEPFVIEKRYLRGDGSALWVSNSVALLRDGEGRPERVVAVSIDVTARRSAERTLGILASAGTALAASLDYEETIRTIATIAVPVLARWALVFTREGDLPFAPVTQACADPGKMELLQRLSQRVAALPPAERHLVTEAFSSGRSRLIPRFDEEMLDELSQDAEYRRLLAEIRPASLMAVPLAGRSQRLGVIVFGTDDPSTRFGADDLAVGEELARRAAIALENARLYERARREEEAARWAADRISRVQRVTAALAGAITVDQVVEQVLAETVPALGADSCIISLAGDGVLDVIGSRGVTPEVLARLETVPFDAGLPLTESFRRGEAIFFGSHEEMAAAYPHLADMLPHVHEAAWAVVPILGERPLGSIAFGFGSPREFAPDLRAFVDGLAQACATALDRARLYAAERVAREEAERARLRAQDLISSVTDAVVAYDRDWRIVYANRTAREAFEASGVPGGGVGEVIWDVRPRLVGERTEANLRRVMDERVPVVFETNETGLPGWREVRAYPTSEGLLAFWSDVTEQRRAREAATLLADAGTALGAVLDVDEALGIVAQLLAERLADFCVIHLCEADGVLRLVAATHRDPELAAMTRSLEERYALPADAPVGAPAVIRTGVASLQRRIAPERIRAAARDAEHLAILERLDLRSSLVVPLAARDRILGAITCVSCGGGTEFDERDLELAEELARRAAVVVDNARLLRDAEAARREAEEANRAKTEFLTTMSHELRTPLNAIAGYAELLDLGIHGPITEQQRQAIGRIARSQRHLLSLVNEVLHFARIDAGRVELDIRAIPVREALEALEPLVDPQARARRLALEWELPPTELLALADDDKLRQVLLNLLSNAIKFTPEGGRIEVSCAEEEGRVRIVVADTGPGIAPEDTDRIFDPFVQLDRSLGNPMEGTGLGLAISRTLAEAMEGTLTVESVKGEGSRFALTLPRG